MLLEAITIHKDIVKVHNYILIKHIEENLVHQTFKRLMGRNEPEVHYHPLKETIFGHKYTAVLVLWGDPDLMVSHGQVFL